jgi:hypothetical protein
MMSTHEDYSKWILDQLKQINPHAKDKTQSYIWASGFLASYLAGKMLEDPGLAHKFKRDLDLIKRVKTKTS